MSAALTMPERFADWRDGLHAGMPEARYHQRVLGVVSKSALTKFAKTPLHYRAWIDGAAEETETDALVFGRAFHCAVLEPDRFDRSYVVAPSFGDCRKRDNKLARDAWRADNVGRLHLDAGDAERIAGMCSAVRAHPLASRMILDGEAELSALWTDEETGLRCRARADFYSRKHRMIADVKSCEDASPEGFRRAAFRYLYHWQHAIYRGGFAALGERVEHFVFVAVEKAAPFAVATYTLDSLGVALGHDRVRLLMRRMAECAQSNDWPGYDPGIQTIETPPWET